MSRLFGTDGVRGVANSELTPELAYQIGRSGAFVLTEETSHKPKILIGKDTRISGDLLESALIAGICSVGADAIVAGVIPTPAIAHLVREENLDAGVMISASHNPFEHNGIKFFNGDGYKLSDATEDRIEAIILDDAEPVHSETHEHIGTVSRDFSLCGKYIDFAKSTVGCDFTGLKVAIDCANGASTVTAQQTLEALGAEVIVIHNDPDGININHNCGSTHMNDLIKLTIESGADVGLAFDGDADRVMAVDENGSLVDGDKIMAVIGLDMRDEGLLKDDTVVATVMSNLGFFVMADEQKLNVSRTKVGDRYVLEEMVEKGYTLGGEQSGHIIMLKHNTTGDGLVTGLALIAVMKKTGKKLSELAGVMQTYPQVLINAKIKSENKNAYLTDAEITSAISKIEAEFSTTGRVLIRPSGTEPLVRVMIEGKNQELITRRAQELADLIVKKLGA